MSETLDAIVSQRIWLDYFDQNIKFDEAFTPQSCKILRRFVGTNGENDWYLVELGVPVKYEGAMYHHLMIRSRWVGCKVGDRQPTAVFIVLVPDVNKLTDPFKIKCRFIKHGVWRIKIPKQPERKRLNDNMLATSCKR